MNDRFSIARVLRDTAAMLKDGWAGILLVIAVFALATWVSTRWLPMATAGLLPAIDHPALRATLSSLWQAAYSALFAGAVLQVVLTGSARRDRRGPLAPFRTMAVCFPAVFPAYLLVAVPQTINTTILSSLMTSDSIASRVSQATTSTMVSLPVGVIALVIFTFLASAPAAAVAEDLTPAAALVRSAQLTRKRRPQLFAVYLAIATVAAIIFAALLFLWTSSPQAFADDAHRMPPPLVTSGLGFLWLMLQVVGAAAVYRELRRLNDPAAQIDETVEVFS